MTSTIVAMATSSMLPDSAEDDAFGSDSPCNIHNCPIEWSIYQYRPSIAANAIFLALFAIIGITHGYLGFRWRSWGFMGGMLTGCLVEIIGYIGRIMLWNNPFSFIGFMIQIVCLTIAPVFFTASIYVTLSKVIMFLAPELSRFKPQLFYWIFIPFDIVCLMLQCAGGALSAGGDEGDGSDDMGVALSQAGLILQVIIIVLFMACFADYLIRYWRSGRATSFNWRFAAFFAGLTTAVVLILTRCAYRVAELQEGYSGEMITHEIPFIVLEGLAIILACVALCFGHPGLILEKDLNRDYEKGIALESRDVSRDNLTS